MVTASTDNRSHRTTHGDRAASRSAWIGSWDSIDHARIVLTERADNGERVVPRVCCWRSRRP
jgi:hypothetical protein